MQLHYKYQPAQGFQQVVSPDNSDLNFLDFGLLRLSEGQSFEAPAQPERETALVLLGGKADLSAGDEEFSSVGQRANVFDGRASALYVPRNTAWRVSALSDLEIAVCTAPCKNDHPVRLITPDDVYSRLVGRDNWSRRVEDIILNNVEADHLMVGETFNPPGNWSSYPPHKHDVENPPTEVKLEELYHYRLSPEQGFGLQRIYTAEGDLDVTFCVQQADTIVIPRGYHPVVAGGGYQLYYLWVLSGHGRAMHPNDDPAHSWVKEES